MKQILAAIKEENNRLKAEIDHAIQVALQSAYLEACMVEAQTPAAEKEARKVKEAKMSEALLHHQQQLQHQQEREHPVGARADATAAVPTTDVARAAPPLSGNPPHQVPTPMHASTSYRDREMTPRRRSEEPKRKKSGRSPLGKAPFKEGISQDGRKAQKSTEEEARREAVRKAAVEENRTKSPIFSPDLHAILLAADAVRRGKGLEAHTIESFLLHLQTQVSHPHAAHQNASPQDPMEQELHHNPGHSQGAPVEGHCQQGRQ